MLILLPSWVLTTMFILKINSLVSYTVLPLATDNKEDNIIKNQIGNAIVKRIIRAHEEQEKFKVFVLMPLMPAFPADLSTKDAATAR
ncbi:hypothetical protein G6F42_028789 [Rhizopus arrhizus]|nr:hypothetical protein G6F42_028789 [Rhizopus arrhizus]